MVTIPQTEISGEVLDVLAFNETVLDQRGDEVKRCLQAFQMAQEYRKTNPAESDSIMAMHMGIST